MSLPHETASALDPQAKAVIDLVIKSGRPPYHKLAPKDARQLFRSMKRILALPPETRLWICHDYKAPGRDTYAWESTVAEQRAMNPHVKDGVTEDEFVAFRTARDAKLAAPLLLLPSIQVNIRAGRFPPAESNGVRYLLVPVTPRKTEALA